MDEIRYLIILPEKPSWQIIATNLIRCIKEQVEGASVYCLANQNCSFILDANPNITKVFYVQKTEVLVKEFENIRIDYIIDLQRSRLSYKIRKKLRLVSFEMKKIIPFQKHFVKFKKDKLKGKHLNDFMFETVSVFDVKYDGKLPDTYHPSDSLEALKCLPNSFKDGFIILSLDSDSPTNTIPESELISLLKEIQYPIAIVGSEKIAEEAELLKFTCKRKIYNTAGHYNYDQLIPLIKKSELVIGYNNEVLHLAAALNKKIISIWGSGVPEFGEYPITNNHHDIVEVKGLKCRPCAIGFRKKCPKKHFRCIKDLPLNNLNYRIFEEINKPDVDL